MENFQTGLHAVVAFKLQKGISLGLLALLLCAVADRLWLDFRKMLADRAICGCVWQIT